MAQPQLLEASTQCARRQTRGHQSAESTDLESSLRVAGGSSKENTWLDETRRRVYCWWLALPLQLPSQRDLGGCVSALALHLGTRLDDAWQLGRTAQAQSGTDAARTVSESKAVCEWLSLSWEGSAIVPPKGSQLQIQLPLEPRSRAVPQWQLLPRIPSVLSGWQQLQSLVGPTTQQSTAGDVAVGATQLGAWQPSVRLILVGTSCGFGVAACSAAVLALIGRRIKAAPLRGRVSVRKGMPQ